MTSTIGSQAEYVKREEAQTLQYQFYEDEADPDKYMLIER